MVLFKYLLNVSKLNKCRSYVTSNIVELSKIRNIGISAHIDSGKTTVTERILFYTGKVNSMHEVKGKDGVGAVMDFMELERQRGITIQSAATYTEWKDHVINIIDTPGHVDFTVEVERALRVLDGAVLVLCAVGGVQSQTLTVNRQMTRYGVPRIAFINKLDRGGANHERVLYQIKNKLKHNAAFLQLPIKLESANEGIVDIIKEKAIYFDDPFGLKIREEAVPEDMVELVKQKKNELIEAVANADDEIGELFLSEQEITMKVLKQGIRRACINLNFTPVLMGTALKNRGIQTLLDAVVDYLPNPSEVKNYALDQKSETESEKILLNPERSDKHKFLALAFKLELGKYGQLTYLRMYQGKLSRGDQIVNVRTGKKVKVARLVRMNAQNMDDIHESYSGDITALFGVDCASGDTFMHANDKQILSMESMFIPEPVVSMSITLLDNRKADGFMKAIRRFLKEDPTFQMTYDDESKQTILHGMGELHLDIYAQRIEREYGAPVELGKPKVAFREVLMEPIKFDYLHKKQSGGAGQYGRVIGIAEPLPLDEITKFKFVDETSGMNIPKVFVSSVEKGMRFVDKGLIAGQKISGVKIRLQDGANHCVDSSDWAFQLAGRGAMNDIIAEGVWKVIEPIVNVEIVSPSEFSGAILSGISRRNGVITSNEENEGNTVVNCQVPLNDMFGFTGFIRARSEGKAEFSMEFSHYDYARQETSDQLAKEYEAELEQVQQLREAKK